jgi:hypothetical protein
MKFKKWLNEQSYVGVEDADSSQIERIYKKSRLAVKIVQDYDNQTANNYLTNITTIAPLNKAGVYGLYNSAENKAVLGKQYNKQKFTFTQEELDKMASLPGDVLRQHKIPEEIINSIQPTDTIHINVLNIYDTFNKAQKTGKMSPEEAQINIIREIASTIVHESTHEADKRLHGKTSEIRPLEAEKKFNNWFDQNLASLKIKYLELTKLD